MKTHFETIAFGILGLVCAGSALFCGAYWHFGTAAVCGLMFWALRSEEIEEQEIEKRQREKSHGDK